MVSCVFLTIISILLNGDLNIFQIIKQNIKPEDFQYEDSDENIWE